MRRTRNRKKRCIRIFVSVLLFCLLCLTLSIVLSAEGLSIEHYYLQGDVTSPIRVVQLTDLHNHEFGKNNKRLIKKVQEQSPDLIFITGDMINENDENTNIICNLIEQLCTIAPVYYGYGNDEYEWENNFDADLELLLTEAGAIVLNCRYEDIVVNGQAVRIGGYYGYYRAPHMRTDDEEQQKMELEFADSFENTSDMKLLLCHIPTAWLDWNYIDKYPVNVVFCGHYHGGQVRIPFMGGLYAPYVGLLPKYTKGLFEGERASCVLSAGLGTGGAIPRVNNIPEVIVMDLIPEE